jgi:cullin 1
LLKVFGKYNELVVAGFKNDLGFVTSLDKACRRYINNNAVCAAAKSASKSPELVARFTDQLLKKSNKSADPSEIERVLDDVVCSTRVPSVVLVVGATGVQATNDIIIMCHLWKMVIFKYIDEKDVFMTFYSKSLARRLINATYASEDLERIMIEKLKVRTETHTHTLSLLLSLTH